jgi:hypothetical protein
MHCGLFVVISSQQATHLHVTSTHKIVLMRRNSVSSHLHHRNRWHGAECEPVRFGPENGDEELEREGGDEMVEVERLAGGESEKGRALF